MSKKFWQTKAFKELEDLWRQKLAQAGFIDAEVPVKGKLMLRQKANNCYRQACAVVRENKKLYYDLIGIHYHKEEFDDDVERLVMERRATGVKIKHISDELRVLGERCHRETIRNIIKKYEIKWQIKKR